ncbi:protein GOLM2 isoform X2 [Callorhinchus milii]|uniref:Protein GOLM2 n=1 Tax=Callorhinchus milii TaxID=7868 RepID=A0A4W3JKT0_CALMI|nr:protein GOLM2 isoform X2 [Callorhinchus milii]|eukprot:gi/632938037/ref/XP_007903503.1/ PREDICTED: protein CASC4 isoform X2 [Callorhinchus milii]
MMFGNSRRGGRVPSFLAVGLLLLIGVLSFNYWVISAKHSSLQQELAELHTQVKKTETAKSRLEKRNSELMGQVDSHRRQIDEKEDEFHNLGSQLQTKDNLVKKCLDEKIKHQNNITEQLSLIHRLQEQLAELRQAFMRQEDQLQEYRKNTTSLEKKLEYESLQCGQQISALKEQWEEKFRTLGKLYEQPPKLQLDVEKQNQVEEANPQPVDRLHVKDKVIGDLVVPKAGDDGGNKVLPHLDSEKKNTNLGKPDDDDAGMPEMEDNDLGKSIDASIDRKKNAVNFHDDENGIVAVIGGPEDNPQPEAKSAHHFERSLSVQLPPNHAGFHANQGIMGKTSKQKLHLPDSLENRELVDGQNEELPVKADEIGEALRLQPARDLEGKREEHMGNGAVVQPPPNPALRFVPPHGLSNSPGHRSRIGINDKANDHGDHFKHQPDDEEQELPVDLNNPAEGYENRHFVADGL